VSTWLTHKPCCCQPESSPTCQRQNPGTVPVQRHFHHSGSHPVPHFIGEVFISFLELSCNFLGPEMHSLDTLYPALTITGMEPKGDRVIVVTAATVHNRRRQYNWTDLSRSHLEVGVVCTDPELVWVAQSFISDLIGFSEPVGTTHVGPQPNLVYMVFNDAERKTETDERLDVHACTPGQRALHAKPPRRQTRIACQHEIGS
jgi:hypothetical protein